MSLVCIQCSLRAMLEQKPSPTFDETPEEHVARVHPDPEATARERAELEARFMEARTEGVVVISEDGPPPPIEGYNLN